MSKVTFIISEIDGSEHAIIDLGGKKFISMTKAEYEKQFGNVVEDAE